MAGKGVSGVKSNTQVLDCIGRGGRISKKLSREFVDEELSGLSITNDNKFSFLRVEFKFHTSHPVLDTCETLSKLSKISNGQSSYGPVLDTFGCHQHIVGGSH